MWLWFVNSFLVKTEFKSIYSWQCGDEDEKQTMEVFSAKTPLSSRFSIQIPLGKKHHLAVVDVFEDTQLVAKVFSVQDRCHALW